MTGVLADWTSTQALAKPADGDDVDIEVFAGVQTLDSGGTKALNLLHRRRETTTAVPLLT